jgi:hypothetical protein
VSLFALRGGRARPAPDTAPETERVPETV